MKHFAYDLAGKRVWIAGHRGMVGSALMRRMESERCELLTVSRADADLRRQIDVERWIAREKPDTVIVAAATVGGILANDARPAEFLYDNISIETNIIEASYRNGVNRLLFLGSSCIYPRMASQPIREDTLLTGQLEATNQWYAIAKIAGVMMCRAYRRQYGCDFISAMPTNLFGPGDNYDLATGHVVPALIAKASAAKRAGSKELEVWGSGKPRREFMYVDDAADALVFLLKNYSDEEHINVGVGYDVTIRELAETIREVVGAPCEIRFDTSKPDGTPRKLMDSHRLFAMGWSPKTSLQAGLQKTYESYLRERGAFSP